MNRVVRNFKKAVVVALSLGVLLPSSVQSPVAHAAFYEAGTFNGIAEGYGGEINVEVSLTEDRIVSIETSHNETDGIGARAIDDLTTYVLENQTLNVDTVSGATKSSEAFITALGLALSAAGANVEDLEAKDTEDDLKATELEDQETDVVIVGAGLSGMLAAIELQQNYPNLDFVLLEQMPMVGGSLAGTGGAIFATDSQMHIDQDLVSTPEDVVAYFEKSSGTELDAQLLENVFGLSGETLDYLIEAGVPFQEELGQSTSHDDKLYVAWAVDRGVGFHAALEEHVENLGMDLRKNSEVTELLVEDSAVIGVKVMSNEGTYHLKADKVLLTAGGFGANEELRAELVTDEYTNGVWEVLAGSTGSGFMMTEQFGTPVIGEGTMGTYYTPEGYRLPVVPFMVNNEAKRFISEMELGYRIQRAMVDKSDGSMYLIVDSNYPDLETVKNGAEFPGGSSDIPGGLFTEFETIEALANEFGLNPEVLQTEVDEYNAAIEAGESPGFDLPVEVASPILTAPFYGVKAVVRTFATIPGIQINANMQVLDGDGNPVENLYASGELTAGNAFNVQYPGAGIGISYASNSGRWAAKVIGELLAE